MRHIRLNQIYAQIFATEDGKNVRERLLKAHTKCAKMPSADRKGHIDNNGANKWRPLKDQLTDLLGKKCWYTEVELTGAHLAIDHFRPVHLYWWLAYDTRNYRVSCPFANSPEHNAEHGCAGGKGKSFPLLPPAVLATGRNRLRIELPMILDPCDARDCDLLAFQADGRPVINPKYATDPISIRRVEESKILLNLDHPDFNSKREQLCMEIKDEVEVHEDLPPGSPLRQTIKARLENKLKPKAPFSMAAKFYLSHHRHLDWVQRILDAA